MASRRVALVFAGLLAAQPVSAYSVLTHEQLVDLVWKDDLQPLLLRRFPGTSTEDLRRARAFAYGGSVVPDLGYYPFGSHYFSNLVHYARSGDFVAALVRYGSEVTYNEGPAEHIATEFGFDVVQVAKNRYTSDRYHEFIGFEVSKTTEDLYVRSIDRTLDTYRGRLREQARGALALPNLDWDTGEPTRLGEYPLADETYARLLHDHARRGFQGTPDELRRHVLAYYGERDTRGAATVHGDWRRIAQELEQLASTIRVRPAATLE